MTAVDFPAPAPPHYSGSDSAGRPWKKAAIITAAIAGVELVVLVVVALAFIAKPFATDASATNGAAGTAAVDASGLHARSEVPVLVLNGNGVAGAATQAAKTVRRLDYPVVQVADASRKDFARTLVMYREGSRPAAVRLARDLDLPTKRAAPLDGVPPGDLMGAELVLVIGG